MFLNSKKIKLAILAALVVSMTTNVFGAELIRLNFTVAPQKSDFCLFNGANASDNLANTATTSAVTQVGTARCDTAGKITVNYDIEGFTPAAKGSIIAAVNTLAKSPQSTQLFNKMFADMGGTLKVVKDNTSSNNFAFSAGAPNCQGSYIIVYNLDLEPPVAAQYVIIHELGHVLSRCRPDLYKLFINSGIVEKDGPILTYPFSVYKIPCADAINIYKYSEGFAEMNTDYVVYKTYNYFPRPCTNYPGGPFPDYPVRQPNYYNFVKDNYYGGAQF